MQIIFRGNEVLFTATVLDDTGAAATPDSVSLYLNYVVAGGRTTTAPMGMTLADSAWTVSWDTTGTGALPGIVYYTVRAVNPSADQDGSFYLDAFPSNPG